MRLLFRLLFSEREIEIIEDALRMFRARNEVIVDRGEKSDFEIKIAYARALDSDDLIIRIGRLKRGIKWL